MNSFFRKLRWLTRRPDKEAELREELQFHIYFSARRFGLVSGSPKSRA